MKILKVMLRPVKERGLGCKYDFYDIRQNRQNLYTELILINCRYRMSNPEDEIKNISMYKQLVDLFVNELKIPIHESGRYPPL